MTPIQIHPAKEPGLHQQFLALYSECFPVAAERENPERWPSRMTENPPPGQPATFIQGMVDDQKVLVGGVVSEFYRQSQCGLITYIAVDPSHRRQGIGKTLRDAAIQNLRRISHGNLRAVFSEMEDPEKVEESKERAKFFEAIGSHKVDIGYIQPDLGDGNGPVENLILLWHPVTGTPSKPNPADLFTFLHEFYQSLGIETPEEDAQFQKMAGNLPHTGPCRNLFASEKEVREAFAQMNDGTREDLRELAAARREGERNLRRGIL